MGARSAPPPASRSSAGVFAAAMADPQEVV
jgi:hypothetical protein